MSETVVATGHAGNSSFVFILILVVIVYKAIQGILKNREQIRKSIDSEVSKNEAEDGISTKSETSITSTQEQRKNYLQTLPITQ